MIQNKSGQINHINLPAFIKRLLVYRIRSSTYFYLLLKREILIVAQILYSVYTVVGETVRKPLRGDNRILNVGL